MCLMLEYLMIMLFELIELACCLRLLAISTDFNSFALVESKCNLIKKFQYRVKTITALGEPIRRFITRKMCNISCIYLFVCFDRCFKFKRNWNGKSGKIDLKMLNCL